MQGESFVDKNLEPERQHVYALAYSDVNDFKEARFIPVLAEYLPQHFQIHSLETMLPHFKVERVEDRGHPGKAGRSSDYLLSCIECLKRQFVLLREIFQ